MSRYKKLLSNTLILSIGTFGSKLLVYFLMPLYTSILSPSQYGSADLVTNAANLMIPFCCIGITHAVFRFSADSEEDSKTVFSSGMTVLIISSAVFLALSPIMLFVPYINDFVWLLVVYVICSNFHTICAEYIRAKGHTALFALQGIIGTALTIAFNLLFLIPLNMGVVGYVLSVAAADFLGTIFLILFAKLYRDFSFRLVSKPKIKDMLKYGIPMMPTVVIWWITNVSDRFIVAHVCGEAENGLYSAAYKIPTLITLVATVFIEAWQLSAISDSTDGDDRKKFFSEVFERYQAIIFLACSVLIAMSKIIAGFLLAKSYSKAADFIPVLLIATVFSSLTTFMGSVYTVSKKTVMSMITALAGALLNIVLNIIMIPQYGAQGAGIATLISYFCVFVIRAVDSKKCMPFRLGILNIAINTVIVIIQTIFMVCSLPYNIFIQIALLVIMLCINAKSISSAISTVLSFFVKNKKNA